ncbi:MAG: pirin family protein, partial [Myxococcales bacterium]|nr:pirin family protein [Myxococcales bacterium]
MSVVLETFQLGFPFHTFDPFLFCVHHDDRYPKGNAQLGPDVSLAGRNLGQDFTIKDGFRMYHGRVVPGFPRHPHRGFETVTLVRKGRIDHSDSLGARARFGGGDVQWMTAGNGIEHCEMFPMLHTDKGNHVELFQIWLNLPARSKRVAPHFKMLWGHTLPTVTVHDDADRPVEVACVAGGLAGGPIPAPPPASWAADPANEVVIATIRLGENATYTLPAASPGLNRALYAFVEGEVTVDGT